MCVCTFSIHSQSIQTPRRLCSCECYRHYLRKCAYVCRAHIPRCVCTSTLLFLLAALSGKRDVTLWNKLHVGGEVLINPSIFPSVSCPSLFQPTTTLIKKCYHPDWGDMKGEWAARLIQSRVDSLFLISPITHWTEVRKRVTKSKYSLLCFSASMLKQDCTAVAKGETVTAVSDSPAISFKCHY